VLPTPGGPHRIIEWGLPLSKASRNGLPGPMRCDCPITSSRVVGRKASASGAVGRMVKRSDMGGAGALRRLPDHVDAGRGREIEFAGRHVGVAADAGEGEPVDL